MGTTVFCLKVVTHPSPNPARLGLNSELIVYLFLPLLFSAKIPQTCSSDVFFRIYSVAALCLVAVFCVAEVGLFTAYWSTLSKEK